MDPTTAIMLLGGMSGGQQNQMQSAGMNPYNNQMGQGMLGQKPPGGFGAQMNFLGANPLQAPVVPPAYQGQ